MTSDWISDIWASCWGGDETPALTMSPTTSRAAELSSPSCQDGNILREETKAHPEDDWNLQKTLMTQEYQQMLYGDATYHDSDVPRGWPEKPRVMIS